MLLGHPVEPHLCQVGTSDPLSQAYCLHLQVLSASLINAARTREAQESSLSNTRKYWERLGLPVLALAKEAVLPLVTYASHQLCNPSSPHEGRAAPLPPSPKGCEEWLTQSF